VKRASCCQVINNGVNGGAALLLRMVLGKNEPAGNLNETHPDAAAVALRSLQWLAIEPGIRLPPRPARPPRAWRALVTVTGAGRRETIVGSGAVPALCERLLPPPDKDESGVDLAAVDASFRKVRATARGTAAAAGRGVCEGCGRAGDR